MRTSRVGERRIDGRSPTIHSFTNFGNVLHLASLQMPAGKSLCIATSNPPYASRPFTLSLVSTRAARTHLTKLATHRATVITSHKNVCAPRCRFPVTLNGGSSNATPLCLHAFPRREASPPLSPYDGRSLRPRRLPPNRENPVLPAGILLPASRPAFLANHARQSCPLGLHIPYPQPHRRSMRHSHAPRECSHRCSWTLGLAEARDGPFHPAGPGVAQ